MLFPKISIFGPVRVKLLDHPDLESACEHGRSMLIFDSFDLRIPMLKYTQRERYFSNGHRCVLPQ